MDILPWVVVFGLSVMFFQGTVVAGRYLQRTFLTKNLQAVMERFSPAGEGIGQLRKYAAYSRDAPGSKRIIQVRVAGGQSYLYVQEYDPFAILLRLRAAQIPKCELGGAQCVTLPSYAKVLVRRPVEINVIGTPVSLIVPEAVLDELRGTEAV